MVFCRFLLVSLTSKLCLTSKVSLTSNAGLLPVGIGWKGVFGMIERMIDFAHPGYRLVLSVRIIMIYNTFSEMSIQVKLWDHTCLMIVGH